MNEINNPLNKAVWGTSEVSCLLTIWDCSSKVSSGRKSSWLDTECLLPHLRRPRNHEQYISIAFKLASLKHRVPWIDEDKCLALSGFRIFSNCFLSEYALSILEKLVHCFLFSILATEIKFHYNPDPSCVTCFISLGVLRIILLFQVFWNVVITFIWIFLYYIHFGSRVLF